MTGFEPQTSGSRSDCSALIKNGLVRLNWPNLDFFFIFHKLRRLRTNEPKFDSIFTQKLLKLNFEKWAEQKPDRTGFETSF